MKQYVLIAWTLAALTVCGRAGEANQTATSPGASPAGTSNDALALLAAAPSLSQPFASPVITTNVSTNPPAWDGTIALGLTATAGNSDSAVGTANIRAHWKAPRDEWTSGSEAAYGKVNSVKNNEMLHAFSQYNHLFSERWYGYARADGLHDSIADVTYRVTGSAGAGYYFIKANQTFLAGEFGPAVLHEKLDGEYHTFPVVRLAERFEHKFDGHARLWQNVEFLPPATSPRDFLVNAEIGVETPLTKHLSLQTFVQDNFANHPAPGRKNNDVKLVSAVAVKF